MSKLKGWIIYIAAVAGFGWVVGWTYAELLPKTWRTLVARTVGGRSFRIAQPIVGDRYLVEFSANGRTLRFDAAGRFRKVSEETWLCRDRFLLLTIEGVTQMDSMTEPQHLELLFDFDRPTQVEASCNGCGDITGDNAAIFRKVESLQKVCLTASAR
ncbi:MAG: hypothetical protein HY820_02315 [Acidobacteria bacterium]|nr:hypothetical protein [Acidobacteriota bacterium]